jgi:LmbE family N-acetylglucosaminyl deacetylase
MPALLAVTAHPDDECFLFGGALALHAERGDRVGILCLTDGDAGRSNGLAEGMDLAAVRREELRRACEVLGIEHVFFGGLPDGGLDSVADERGTAIVAGHAGRFAADVLLTFGPEGASGHGDHKACWRWTLAAAGDRRVYAATVPQSLLGSENAERRGRPPLPITTVVDISSLGDRKRRAFLEHRTQHDHLELFDRILAGFEGREYYSRVRPAWREGDPLEFSLIRP